MPDSFHLCVHGISSRDDETSPVVVTASKAASGPKNVHHFCTVTDDVMLPDYYRGTWRKYHVPSKHDNFMRAAGVSQQQQRVALSVFVNPHSDAHMS